jgi:hypothetical protein
MSYPQDVKAVDKARQGTRNRTAGLAWMQAGVRYLRTWWPSAERQLHAGRADIAGVGDLMVEMTTEPWAKLWVKLDQAERDAQRDVLPAGTWVTLPFCVWKKHNRRDDGVGLGPVDPGEGAVIFRARVIFPLLARLEQLERELDTATEMLAGEDI